MATKKRAAPRSTSGTRTKRKRATTKKPAGFKIVQLDEKAQKLYATFLKKLKIQKQGDAAGKVANQIKEQLIAEMRGATVAQFPDGSAIVVTEHHRDMAPLPAKRIDWQQISKLGS